MDGIAPGGAGFFSGNDTSLDYCTFFADALGSAPYSEYPTPLTNYVFTPLPLPGSEITAASLMQSFACTVVSWAERAQI